jgi:hypothetical protein
MSASDEIAALQAQVDASLKAYLGRKGELMELAAPFKPIRDFADNIEEVSEEFGVQGALNRLAENPARFGLQSAPDGRAVLEALAHAITVLWVAVEVLDATTDRREKLLEERDPSYLRVFNFNGREARFDVERGKFNFVDQPGTTFSLDFKIIDPARRFERDRDRSRSSRSR